MKVLLVNGSLKQDGACAEALAEAEKRLRGQGAETAVFWPVRTENLACSGCGACKGAGMCVADPRPGAFLREAAEFDTLVFFIPVGLFGPSVDMIHFIRRVAQINSTREGKRLAGKTAAAIAVGRRSAKNDARVRALLAELGLPEKEDLL